LSDAEKGQQLRSQLAKVLNVAQSYASGFDSLAALLDDLFERPSIFDISILKIAANCVLGSPQSST
jgi:hypothetical protein